MKLRNKETGKIRNFEFVVISKDMDAEFAKYAHHAPVLICRSIDQLNEEWEDYKPKEPLIGDEATAKFVRDWAKHWEIDELVAHIYEGSICLVGWTEPRTRGRAIDILSAFVSGEVEEGGHYTIDELCGEEDE